MGHATTHDIYARALHASILDVSLTMNGLQTHHMSESSEETRVNKHKIIFNNLDCNLQEDYVVKLRISVKSRKLYFSRQTEGF